MKWIRPASRIASKCGLSASVLLLVLLALSAAGSACRPGEESERRILIGLIADREAASGPDVLDAATMVLESVRQQGGLERPEGRFELDLMIERVSTPDEALAAARRLVSAGALAIIGPSISRHAIPVATVVEFAQVPMISPKSTHPLTTQNKRYAFRVAFNDDFQGRILARFAYQRLEARRVAVLFDGASDYNRHIAHVFGDAFSGLGGEVSAMVSYVTGEKDFSPLVSELLASEPELVFLPNYQAEIVPQARQLRAQGFDGPLLGGDGWEPGETADPALVGSFYCRHWYAAENGGSPRTSVFVSAFEKRFGRAPDDLAALSYDAFGLLLESLEHADRLEPSAVRDQLAEIERFPGVTGEITYRGGTGDPEKPVFIFRIDEKARSVPFAAATVDTATERETLDLSELPGSDP